MYRMDVSAYVAKQMLRELPIFSILDSYTIGLIALKMKSISCNAGYKLFQSNDPAKEIYIQRSGKSLFFYSERIIYNMEERLQKKENTFKNEIVNDQFGTTAKKYLSTKSRKIDDNAANWVEFGQELQRGSVAGELALVYPTRVYSLQCLTWCEFYVIDVQDIWAVLEQEYQGSFVVMFDIIYFFLCLFVCLNMKRKNKNKQEKYELMKAYARTKHEKALRNRIFDIMELDLNRRDRRRRGVSSFAPVHPSSRLFGSKSRRAMDRKRKSTSKNNNKNNEANSNEIRQDPNIVESETGMNNNNTIGNDSNENSNNNNKPQIGWKTA